MSCEGKVSTCTGEQQVTSRFPPAPMSFTFSDRFRNIAIDLLVQLMRPKREAMGE